MGGGHAGDVAGPSELASEDVRLSGIDSGVSEGGGVGDVVMPRLPSGSSGDCAGAAVVEGAELVEEPSSETPRFGSEQQDPKHEGDLNGGFGANADVPRFGDGLARGAEGLASLGDVVVDVDAVAEAFLKLCL